MVEILPKSTHLILIWTRDGWQVTMLALLILRIFSFSVDSSSPTLLMVRQPPTSDGEARRGAEGEKERKKDGVQYLELASRGGARGYLAGVYDTGRRVYSIVFFSTSPEFLGLSTVSGATHRLPECHEAVSGSLVCCILEQEREICSSFRLFDSVSRSPFLSPSSSDHCMPIII